MAMQATTPKPSRNMFPDDASWKAAVRAWRESLQASGGMTTLNMQSGQYHMPADQQIKTPKAGMPSTYGGAPAKPPEQGTAGIIPAPGSTSSGTRKNPYEGTGGEKEMVPGETWSPPTVSSSVNQWWKNPNDDYTPDGGAGWNGTGDLEADHPDWWGEVRNFDPMHREAMKNAYRANDEAAFQQIRDKARADLYGANSGGGSTNGNDQGSQRGFQGERSLDGQGFMNSDSSPRFLQGTRAEFGGDDNYGMDDWQRVIKNGGKTTVKKGRFTY